MTNPSSIPIVFCFDNNFALPAFISISSLSYYAKEQTHYIVYCVVNKDLTDANKAHIQSLSNKNLTINFVEAKSTFQNAHQHRGITESTYYRLMLHDLLPQENKILYLDVDVLINDDLSELYNINLDGYIIGGVRNLYIHQVFEEHLVEIPYWKEHFSNAKYTYINAGVLLINLEKIRLTKIWEKWLELAKYKWEYHDQDILNMSCKNKILFLSPKFNATYAVRAKGADQWDLFSKYELSEKPVIYHFTAKKPWDSKYMDQSTVWWNFVKNNTTQYSYFYKRYNKEDVIRKKLNRISLKMKRVFTIIFPRSSK
ncbi:glycosyltransferase family 8 protein [Kaistella sp. 97-N-M2]|uniref:glycosyltransferase family 8 protein n=1 Tax=Kaistella sp. 97-N-M2 TaxID=2908645 RepID=UPI001F2725A6|nr:glycosyltransferase family 8 protein [Kaistella sp. 97-N-M2]UJF29146.1 glycosyltransferase family 8 protein [Kaistella sp. 97-N-M2]